MSNQEPEKPIQPPTSPATFFSDEVIEAVEKMSVEDIKLPDAGLKLLIAQYKEKCFENRTLQNKMSTLNNDKAVLSDKLSVARERLKQIGGIGTVFNFINIIAGAIITFASFLENGHLKSVLIALGIAIFIICALHYWINRNQQQGI